MYINFNNKKISLGVLLVGISYFFVLVDPWGWNMIIYMLPVYMVFVLQTIILNKGCLQIRKCCVLFCFFAFYTILSLFLVANMDGSIGKTIRHVYECIILISFSSFVFSKHEKNFLIYAYAYSTVAVVIKMVIQRETLDGEAINRYTISNFGKQMDPNYLVGGMLFAVLFLFYQILNKKHKVKEIILLGIVVGAILSTGSRGGLLSLIVGCTCLFLSEKKSYKTILYGGIIVLGAAMVYLLLPSELAFRFSPASFNDGSNSLRLNLWQTSYKIFLTNPIWGRGGNAMRNLGMQYGALRHLIAHSTYLDIFTDYGIVGGVSFFSIIVYLLIMALKKRNSLVLGLIIATSVCGVFISAEDSAFYWQNILMSFMLLQSTNESVDGNIYALKRGNNGK